MEDFLKFDHKKQISVCKQQLNIDMGSYLFLIFYSGNFICDIVLGAVQADCCILNSGSLRSDTLHGKGLFRVRDLKAILPYPDSLLVIEVTGIFNY